MAKAMRSVLVDHARARVADKRGGGARPLSLDATGVVSPLDGGLALEPEDLLAVDETLERLTAQDAERAQVVALRFWAGLSNEEIADAIGVHVHTVERRFQVARAWMQRELSRLGT
jgi:RNA polymerase sigma factor (TIGR02999 family)